MKINKITTIFWAFILVLSFGCAVFAQKSELVLAKGLNKHKGIDSIYRTFSQGYKALRPEMVANLYTEDAAYLSPNDDILTGRKAILKNFTNFFNTIKNNNRTMTISFRIFQRTVKKKIGYDVGVYTINFYKEEKAVGVSKGKFVVVAIKGKDKKWRFGVDGYSSLKPQK